MNVREIPVKIGLYIFGKTLEEDETADGGQFLALHLRPGCALEISHGLMHEICHAVFGELFFHCLHLSVMQKEI